MAVIVARDIDGLYQGEMSHGWSLDLKVKSTGFVDKFG